MSYDFVALIEEFTTQHTSINTQHIIVNELDATRARIKANRIAKAMEILSKSKEINRPRRYTVLGVKSINM